MYDMAKFDCMSCYR